MARKYARIYPHQLKNGETRYRVMFEFEDAATGKRKQVMRTYQTLKEAKLALAEHETRRGRGRTAAPVATTLAECIDRWRAVHSTHIRPSTLATYQATLKRHVLPHLGAVPTAKISMGRIEEHYGVLRAQGVQPGIIRNVHQRLIQILRWGALHGFDIDAGALQTRSPRYQPREMTCWSDEQMARFLAVADGSKYGPIWRTAVLTGMRRGELMGLRWADVGFEECNVRVARTRGKVAGRMVDGPTKNGTVRNISVPPSLIAALRQHRAQQLAQRVACDRPWADPDLVFSGRGGVTPGPDALARDLDRLVERAGLAPIRIHDLRHTHASYLLRHGKNIAEIAARLGHKNQAQTLATYSHSIPDEHKATAMLLEQMFG